MRVALADDAVLLREGLARVLSDAGFEVVGQAGDATELLGLVRTAAPDVAVVDIRMPPTNTNEGLVVAREIRASHPEVGVLVLSQYLEVGPAMTLLTDGARGVGYLLKERIADIDEFTEAVRRVGNGGSVIDPDIVSLLLGRKRRSDPIGALSERERGVLALMAEGYSNGGICQRLFLSPKTVETHVGAIFAKLGLSPGADEHRRVLAVLAFLRSAAGYATQ